MKTAKATTTDRAQMRELLRHFEARRDEMVTTIRRLVEMESPSHNKGAVDRLSAHVAATFERLGGRVKLHRQTEFGDHVQADFPGGERKPILLLGHIDTVWDVGTLAKMPCKIEEGRLWGPGVFDMKAGVGLMMAVIGALKELRGELPRPVTVFLVTDEEVGSDTSRATTENLAKKAEAVLVLEPAHGRDGAVKTARKGVGEYRLKVHGKASHAGLDFLAGQSAIVELARQVVTVTGFTELERGITVNPGVVRGGTRTNVVAAEAEAEIDVRIEKMGDAKRIHRKFQSLRPFNRHCKLEISGGVNRPPMERTKGVAALYGLARELARGLAQELHETAVGGGSDGNFTAGLGIPTLDGLGGVGEGAHAVNESIWIDALPARAALITGLVENIPG
jgi:glutamate carboxypeptidase